jgi:alkyl sulfatase BDS1-like metallo-beta-lactamase superfamily hydrolase
LSGRAVIAEKVQRYRDSLQFLWDQTVRAINQGRTTDEIASSVVLPDLYFQDYLTSERYGVVEHHVRQIHNGLRGWFDGDESKLFPVEPVERYGRLIAGFGGREAVTAQVHHALESNDVRWAAELATWLVRSDGASQADRNLLAQCLRTIAERTSAANIRNWCITRARHLDGTAPIDFLYTNHFLIQGAIKADLEQLTRTLRVLLDPAKVVGVNLHIAFNVDGECVGVHVRNGVAVPTDGNHADATLSLSRNTLNALVSDTRNIHDALAEGEIAIEGNQDNVLATLAAFDLPGFRAAR